MHSSLIDGIIGAPLAIFRPAPRTWRLARMIDLDFRWIEG